MACSATAGSARRSAPTTRPTSGGPPRRLQARPSLPHRSALIEHAMYGRQGGAGTPPALTDLGLYSITFMNDRAGWAARALPRVPHRGRALGLQALPGGVQPERRQRPAERAEVGEFVNDNIVRVLAAVPGSLPAAVPEDRLQRPEGARGAGRLRSEHHRRDSMAPARRAIPSSCSRPRSAAARGSCCSGARSIWPRTRSPWLP